MISSDAFDSMVAALVARGFDPEKAEDYAYRLADVVELDAAGRWVVRGDDGRIIDTIDPIE